MATYKISPDTQNGLYRIWTYGARTFGEAQADKYYSAFFDQFEIIAKDPFIYPSVNHICNGYCRAVCGVDSIYYRINGDIVEIMTIIGRPDIKGKLQKKLIIILLPYLFKYKNRN